MATIEYFFVKIKSLKGIFLDKDLTKILKDKVDKLNPNDMYCEGKSCDVLLAEYRENTEPIYNITFDFSKLTSETITSAIRYNILENIDTFQDLDEKTLALVTYSEREENKVKNILLQLNDIELLILKLEESQIDFFKIYKIIKENNLNKITKNQNLLVLFYKKFLKRYKKEKTFFNTFRLKNRNVLQLQKNINGIDSRKLQKYLNLHLFLEDEIELSFERIYDSEFMEMLKHQELKHFEIKYHSDSKNKLLNDNSNNLLFAISDSFGRNTTKISAIADENSNLNNEKILEFFEMTNKLGILDECRIKPNKKGQRGFIGSNDKGSMLIYSTQYNMKTIDVANLVFIEAYRVNINLLEDRTI